MSPCSQSSSEKRPERQRDGNPKVLAKGRVERNEGSVYIQGHFSAKVRLKEGCLNFYDFFGENLARTTLDAHSDLSGRN